MVRKTYIKPVHAAHNESVIHIHERVCTVAKPDNRADNVEKLQDMIAHTMERIHESEDDLKAHADKISPEQQAEMAAKNERRRDSIEQFRKEIRDEQSQQ